MAEQQQQQQPIIGYDFKSKEKFPSAYQCVICHLLIRKLIELPCSHPYCEQCLLRWEQQKMDEQQGPQTSLKCMVCRNVYVEKDKQHSRMSDRIITTEIEVLCKLHELGCSWFGTIDEFQQHSDTDCLFATISCQFTGCDKVFQRRHRNSHEENCPHKEINCQYCQNVIKQSQTKVHFEEECTQSPTKCPNQGCDVIIPKNEVLNHQNVDCNYQKVLCPLFHKIGCNSEILKLEVEDHNITSNVYHTQLLLKKYLLCENELHDTKSKLEATTKITQKTQSELDDTKLKLETTTTELEIAKKDIVKLETRFEQQHNEIVPLIHKSTEIISQQLNKARTESPEKVFKSSLSILEEPTQLNDSTSNSNERKNI